MHVVPFIFVILGPFVLSLSELIPLGHTWSSMVVVYDRVCSVVAWKKTPTRSCAVAKLLGVIHTLYHGDGPLSPKYTNIHSIATQWPVSVYPNTSLYN